MGLPKMTQRKYSNEYYRESTMPMSPLHPFFLYFSISSNGKWVAQALDPHLCISEINLKATFNYLKGNEILSYCCASTSHIPSVTLKSLRCEEYRNNSSTSCRFQGNYTRPSLQKETHIFRTLVL